MPRSTSMPSRCAAGAPEHGGRTGVIFYHLHLRLAGDVLLRYGLDAAWRAGWRHDQRTFAAEGVTRGSGILGRRERGCAVRDCLLGMQVMS